ncbi:CpsD/CapB family tyrosine-protein kinase [Bacillus sp. SD088]|uniref:CpsD/CapB family tyrosine-protein kinase n=1 Tax=Bacillus sp. SD088 TaxID=2782012 RepID=UPI001A96C96B|nr:CpsD/CapB family tyrosine-protein kinase [Bacillus sp. SD088]MBO0992528.1 CpsD/CapB family tyrosine-protein kinase [Bacillus sp. SD088]
MVLNKSKELEKRVNLITYTNPESVISEQFRTIRTNIQFINGEMGSTTLLITSPDKQEGKTTTAANIAVSMAQKKERILLIDSNLRNPSIHHIFRVANNVGLTDVLLGNSTFEEAVNYSQITNLDILTSGAVLYNPAELFASERMQHLLKKVKSLYDIVLLDSTSVLDVTDTKIIAHLSDGVVLVIRQDKTKIETAVETKKVLDFANARIIGVIFNEKTG